jgi:hypothetical protein
MHKPNKIPGMKLKGIDRLRNRANLYSKRDAARFKEAAKVAKQEREDSKRARSQDGTNKRPSLYDSGSAN